MTQQESELIEAVLDAFDTPTLMAVSVEMKPDPWTRLKHAIRSLKRERAEVARRVEAACDHYERS